MTDWFFDLEQLKRPVREGGANYDERLRLCREAHELLQRVGVSFELPQSAVTTATVYFQRYFAVNEINDAPTFETATACFFLACKVEETPKKLKDIIIKCHECYYNPNRRDPNYRPLLLDSPEFPKLRQKVLQCERLILQTLSFDLTIEQPHKTFKSALNALSLGGDKSMGQMTLNFINDSHRTLLALQVPAAAIKIASIYLAAKIANTEIPRRNKTEWWLDFDVRAEDIITVCQQLLSVYIDSGSDLLNWSVFDLRRLRDNITEEMKQFIKPPAPPTDTSRTANYPPMNNPYYTQYQQQPYSSNPYPQQQQQQVASMNGAPQMGANRGYPPQSYGYQHPPPQYPASNYYMPMTDNSVQYPPAPYPSYPSHAVYPPPAEMQATPAGIQDRAPNQPIHTRRDRTSPNRSNLKASRESDRDRERDRDNRDRDRDRERNRDNRDNRDHRDRDRPNRDYSHKSRDSYSRSPPRKGSRYSDRSRNSDDRRYDRRGRDDYSPDRSRRDKDTQRDRDGRDLRDEIRRDRKDYRRYQDDYSSDSDRDSSKRRDADRRDKDYRSSRRDYSPERTNDKGFERHNYDSRSGRDTYTSADLRNDMEKSTDRDNQDK